MHGNTIHGLYYHPLYSIWNGIMQRCYNENCKGYQYWGGRGIKVCDEWHDIENFINDMYPSYKKGLLINRINNDENYCKENCKWSTRNEQNRNRSMVFLTQEKVNEIRKLYKTGLWTHKNLAKIFGTKREHITDIINYRIWKNV